VERIELERVRERQRVAGHFGDLVVALSLRRLADVAVVEQDGPVASGEGGHLERPGEGVRGQPHDAQERLAVPVHLVVERLVASFDRRHARSLSSDRTLRRE
jgi:hypothetical protein